MGPRTLHGWTKGGAFPWFLFIKHFKADEDNFIADVIEEQKGDSEYSDDQFGDSDSESESQVIDNDSLEEDGEHIFGCVGMMNKVRKQL